MKHTWNYYKIKWTSFFITFAILGTGLAIILIMGRQSEEPGQEAPLEPLPATPSAGHYSNEDFSRLMDENLKELGFLTDIAFQGTGEGSFTIKGTLKDAGRLMAACPELKVYTVLLRALEGETLMMEGHLGEAEDGTGQIIADTLTFADYHISAGEATPYIEQYTTINELFAVPLREITLDESGITFEGELPAFIQTA